MAFTATEGGRVGTSSLHNFSPRLLQELLQVGSPFLWGIGIPLLVILVLVLVPYLLPNTAEKDWGRWLPAGNRAAQILVSAIILFIFTLTILGAIR